MSCWVHHVWKEQMRNENADRIRTLDRCEVCGAFRYGCYAHRLDSDGNAAWGPVGEWRYRMGKE